MVVIRLGNLNGSIKGASMQARSVAEIIDVMVIVPFLFAASGKHNIQPNYLIIAGILAFIAIVFRWYNNLEFHDRFLSVIPEF